MDKHSSSGLPEGMKLSQLKELIGIDSFLGIRSAPTKSSQSYDVIQSSDMEKDIQKSHFKDMEKYIKQNLLDQDMEKAIEKNLFDQSIDMEKFMPKKSTDIAFPEERIQPAIRDVTRDQIPVNLLSFDGGGIKGLLSVRMLTLVFQGFLDPDLTVDDLQWTQIWVRDARRYKDKMTSMGYDLLWLVWAQKMDGIGVKPQVPGKQSWLDFSLENGNDAVMIKQFIDIDLVFEYYLTHVMSISGTSTGGLITGAILLGMSLTQLVALYMDPGTCKMIFPNSWNPLRYEGYFLAKYEPDGKLELVSKILEHVAPCDEKGLANPTFIEAVKAYNEKLENMIMGKSIGTRDKNRLILTIKRALKKLERLDDVDLMIKDHESLVKEASECLSFPKNLRKTEGGGIINKLQIKVKDRDNLDIHPTRCLITARCANNASAVVFDSQEPNEPPSARGRIDLDMSTVSLQDVLLSTTAAPTFFPAHKIGNLSFQDGGVVANDPSLINGSFNFRKFQVSRNSWFNDWDTSVSLEIHIPALKLLRVGCGLEVPKNQAFRPWEGQGRAFLATRVADLFMSTDVDRTEMLCTEIGTTMTLKSVKLNTFVPRMKNPSSLGKQVENQLMELSNYTDSDVDSLPMDKLETLETINALFARIDPRLAYNITIGTNDLMTREREILFDGDDSYACALVNKINETRNWLKDNVAMYKVTVMGYNGTDVD